MPEVIVRGRVLKFDECGERKRKCNSKKAIAMNFIAMVPLFIAGAFSESPGIYFTTLGSGLVLVGVALWKDFKCLFEGITEGMSWL